VGLRERFGPAQVCSRRRGLAVPPLLGKFALRPVVLKETRRVFGWDLGCLYDADMVVVGQSLEGMRSGGTSEREWVIDTGKDKPGIYIFDDLRIEVFNLPYSGVRHLDCPTQASGLVNVGELGIKGFQKR
jgi:hypothetical protein